jgi:hypothetical protein
VPALTLNAVPLQSPVVPDWRRYLSFSEDGLSRCDLGIMNLAFAVGLPGFEQINVTRCLGWLDEATDCVRRWTEAGLEEFFRPNPSEYNNSEAYFRVLGLATVLQRHCGVRYDPSKIGAGPEVPFEFHEQFIHGVIQGPGGTCATLPVVYAAIGRRLGYPIRLVCTKQHLFARWDDPRTGERFNIECAGQGFNDPPDDRYRVWPKPITPEEERAFGYLQSFSPRRELASFLGTRALVLSDHKRYREAAELFCVAAELTPQLATYPRCLACTLVEWKKHLQSQYPPRFPRKVNVYLRPALRRWPSIPWEVEREIAALHLTEYSLNDPDSRATYWEPLRQGRPPIRPVPTSITADYNQLFPEYYRGA